MFVCVAGPASIPLPAAPASAAGYGANTDPYELLESLSRASAGRVRASDFVPLRAGLLLEPFMRLLGFGHFSVRPSPLCAFATLLISTHTPTSASASASAASASAAGGVKQSDAKTEASGGVGLQSIPAARLFDLKKLYELLLPLALKLEKETFGLSTVKQIQKV